MNDSDRPPIPQPVSLALLVPPAEQVFAGRDVDLPTSIVDSNLDRCGQPGFAFTSLCGPYRARRARLDPVTLRRLPPGATLLGNNSFMVHVGDALVAEQISPLTSDIAGLLAAIEVHAPQIEEIDEPCVLVARYGESTWGHWLGEILPAAVVAEHAWPGRFRYVVADCTTHPGPQRDFATAVLESLAAYGIGEDRLLRARDDRQYRFDQLHMLHGLWSSAVLNPDVQAVMRDGIVLPIPPPPDCRRLALLRPEGENRALFNTAQIRETLTRRGYAAVNLQALAFLEQVSAFRHAEEICGILGSGLTGLIYARPGVRVLSIAPADWFDFFFYVLIQQLRGTYVDFRGPVLWNGIGLPRDAPIVVDPVQLGTALSVLRETGLAAGGPTRTICGIEMPIEPDDGFFAIDFSASGNAARYLGDGWSVQEERSIWSVGPFSRVTIPAAELPACGRMADWLLEVELTTFTVPPCLVARQLGIVVNGQLLAQFAISSAVTVSCRIPAACVAGRDAVEILFCHPVCPPANLLGAGEDARPLGSAFLALRLRDLNAPESPRTDRRQLGHERDIDIPASHWQAPASISLI